DRNTILGEEHVLGSTEADTLRAEPSGDICLIRHIGVGADAKLAETVGPGQDRSEPLILVRLLEIELSLNHLNDFGFDDRNIALIDIAVRSIDREIIAFLKRLGTDLHGLA